MGRRRETWKHEEEIDRGREGIHGSKERAEERKELRKKENKRGKLM